jgi:hypothetical protein
VRVARWVGGIDDDTDVFITVAMLLSEKLFSSSFGCFRWSWETLT